MVLDLTSFLGGGESTVEWLVSLPVPSFISAFESYARTHRKRAIEAIYHTFVGAQGSQDSMQGYVDTLRGADASPRNDMQKFVQKFGTSQ